MLPNSIILLSLCFVAICANFKEASLRRNSAAWGNRDSFLLACITQSTLLVFITEGLSVFHLFQSGLFILFVLSQVSGMGQPVTPARVFALVSRDHPGTVRQA